MVFVTGNAGWIHAFGKAAVINDINVLSSHVFCICSLGPFCCILVLPLQLISVVHNLVYPLLYSYYLQDCSLVAFWIIH